MRVTPVKSTATRSSVADRGRSARSATQPGEAGGAGGVDVDAGGLARELVRARERVLADDDRRAAASASIPSHDREPVVGLVVEDAVRDARAAPSPTAT